MAIKKKIEYLILALILGVAAFLRLYRIADYMTFLGDEGRDALWVKRIIIDHKLTLLGPTASVGGFFLGPFYYYLMTPFLWAFRMNPVGPAVMVALFGIATVYLVYKAGKDFFNPPSGGKIGLLAAGFYTVSPLVISYSRSSWNPNIMPFFSLLIIYLTWRTVTEKKYGRLFWVGLLFGLTFQIHYLATFLLVAIGIYLLLFVPWRRHWQSYLAAVVGFVVGWSPFLLFELRHSFSNFRSLYKFIFFGSETGYVPGKFIPIVSNVSYRLFERLVSGNNQILALGLILLTLAFFFRNWFKKPKNPALALLGIWLLVGVLLFGFYQKGIYDYYFGFMFTLPFLLTAFSLTELAKINKLSRCLAISLSCYLVFINLRGMPFQYEPNRQLKQTRDIAHLVLEKTDGSPFNFALITGQNSDHGYRYFLEIWGAKPVTIENAIIDPERKTVTDQLLVVCEKIPCYPEGDSLWEVAGFGRAEIVDNWPAPGGIQVFKLIHYLGDEQ